MPKRCAHCCEQKMAPGRSRAPDHDPPPSESTQDVVIRWLFRQSRGRLVARATSRSRAWARPVCSVAMAAPGGPSRPEIRTNSLRHRTPRETPAPRTMLPRVAQRQGTTPSLMTGRKIAQGLACGPAPASPRETKNTSTDATVTDVQLHDVYLPNNASQPSGI